MIVRSRSSPNLKLVNDRMKS
ncbi:hypothetical protein A2U01_0093019, partial [Trifolium medium]|nr:hypothetical protein [Trifolium medium]